MTHTAQVIIITCIDFRFQKFIDEWIRQNFKEGTYDRGAFAGAGKNTATIVDQIGISHKLHNIKEAVIINHEDCGAYGENGDLTNHVADLLRDKKTIESLFKGVKFRSYYLRLDGFFEQVV